MAYHNDSRSPIRSNLKEKNECSRLTAHKYASFLRIPDDTTWPKIPERKLHDNVENSNKSPYIIACTGKLQKKPTVVQLPHSQFMKAAPIRNNVERNTALATGSVLFLSNNVKERLAPNNLDNKFKTTISQQVDHPDTLKRNQNRCTEQTKEKTITKVNHVKNVNAVDTQNDCPANSSRSAEKRVNVNDVTVATNKSPDDKNSTIVASNKFRNPNTKSSQEFTKFKLPSFQNNAENSKNYEQPAIKVNNIRKKENDMSICSSSNNCENDECKCFSTPERRWLSKKLKPSRLYESDESTDSEVYSSETTTTDHNKRNAIERNRGIYKMTGNMKNEKRENCESKCAHERFARHLEKKVEFDVECLCTKFIDVRRYCTRCRRFWALKKRAHHSEPVIGSLPSRRHRYATARAGGLRTACCANKAADSFHQLAYSDSDCAKSALMPPHCCGPSVVRRDERGGRARCCSLQSIDDYCTSCAHRGAPNWRNFKGEAGPRRRDGRALPPGPLPQPPGAKDLEAAAAAAVRGCSGARYGECRQLLATGGAPLTKKRKVDEERFPGWDKDESAVSSGFDHRDSLPIGSSAAPADVASGQASKAKGIEGLAASEGVVPGATTVQSLTLTSSTRAYDDSQSGKQADRRLLKLKTYVLLLAGVIYTFALFLVPTLYDYFFYEEEYDAYEELSYIQIILEYILSSFQEAFGGLFDFINKIFFQSLLSFFSAPVENVTTLIKHSMYTPFIILFFNASAMALKNVFMHYMSNAFIQQLLTIYEIFKLLEKIHTTN